MELKDLRTVLFGFNKQDTCRYISELNKIYEQREAQEIKEQQETLDRLSQKNEELGNTASRLQQEVTELKRRNNDLQKKLELADRGASELRLQMRKAQALAVSALKETKEQLSAAERQISDLGTEQEHA